MNWWAIVRRPNGAVHVHELGEEPYEVALAAVRAGHNVPADPGPTWDISVSQGEPHPEVLWTRADLAAAKERLESTAGIPAVRAALAQLRTALETVAADLPPESVETMRAEFRRLTKGLREIRLDEVRAELQSVPPSRATVHRLP